MFKQKELLTRALMLRIIVATCLVYVPSITQVALAPPAIDWTIATQNADGSYVLTPVIATATPQKKQEKGSPLWVLLTASVTH